VKRKFFFIRTPLYSEIRISKPWREGKTADDRNAVNADGKKFSARALAGFVAAQPGAQRYNVSG